MALGSLRARLPNRAQVAGGIVQGMMAASAALIAYFPTQPLGLREGFWASITAIAVVQGELGAARTSARDQFAGAAIGGLISAIIISLAGEHLITYALSIVLSTLICRLFTLNNAARLAGSTATIIMLVPHKGSAESMMLSRLAEVAWGVVVGVGIVWLVNKFENRVAVKEQQSR